MFRAKDYRPPSSFMKLGWKSRWWSLASAKGQCSAIKERQVTTVQCLSGSGSLRIGAEFLASRYHQHILYIPLPTYNNHPNFFMATDIPFRTYRYYDSLTIGLDFQGLLEDLHYAPSRAIVLLHACAAMQNKMRFSAKGLQFSSPTSHH